MCSRGLSFTRILVAAGCGFAYFLLDFAAICTRKWLIFLTGLSVR